MKNIHYFFSAAFILAMAVFSSCKEDLYVNEYVPGDAVIKSFYPNKASINSEVTIEGENLNLVDSVWIGDKKMKIKAKVSSSKLSINISSIVDDRQITLFYSEGKEARSETNFLYDFGVTPQIDADDLPDGLNMYKETLITGLDLRVVTKVKFLSGAGFDKITEARILEQNDMAILIQIPFVYSLQTKLVLEYPTGTSSSEDSQPVNMNIARNEPLVDNASVLSNLVAGGSVTLTGTLLDIVEDIQVGSLSAEIVSQNDNELIFNVPTGNFPLGDNPGISITIHFFDGRSQTELSNNTTLFVPFIDIWSNRTVGSRKMTHSFFGFDTGIVYNNAVWGTDIDPVAYGKSTETSTWNGLTCSAANIPSLSEAVYNSVKPYFMLGKSGSNIILTSTTNANNVLCYVWANGKSNPTITLNPYCSGTPVINFIKLDPNTGADKAIIDKVVNREISKIDKSTFPISVAEQKLAGINIKDKRYASINQASFAPEIPMNTPTEEDVNTVVLVLWMNYKGFNPADPVAANINKFGFMHIKKAKLINVDEGTITFDMYWPKENYQY
jgi:hypothetical protein